jgi:hypothetical protein
MDPRHIDELVLATVNAPYKDATDASTLAAAIKDADPRYLPQLHNLFGDVASTLTIRFALNHGITFSELRSAYHSFVVRGGIPYKNFEKALEERDLIHKRAVEVFDDEAKADRWLSQPLAALGNQSPDHVCDTDPDTVMTILEKIAWGVPP